MQNALALCIAFAKNTRMRSCYKVVLLYAISQVTMHDLIPGLGPSIRIHVMSSCPARVHIHVLETRYSLLDGSLLIFISTTRTKEFNYAILIKYM
jgi:hypothetical protein